MPKIRTIVFFLLIGVLIWFFYEDDYKEGGLSDVWYEMKDDFNNLKNNSQIRNTITNLRLGLENLFDSVTDKESEVSPSPNIESPDLTKPSEQTFSIHNIEINDSKSEVENILNDSKRSSLNEYGVNWHTYHDHYQNFVMVAYNEDNEVTALYTNQDLISSSVDLALENDKNDVRDALGEPLDSITKGYVKYRIDDNDDQDTYLIDDNYVTFFYDIHQEDTIAAIQIITESLENEKDDYFASPDNALAEGLEYQLFDLTNAARVKFNEPILEWHEPSKATAQNHSEDMAENNYFGHTNLDGQSPFDRLEDDDITFRMAGENLAAGQPNSIYAHQGLMNSKGHRDNILKSDFRLMSVGVAFQEDGQPFYTEAYLTK
ncbi:Cysteine-rich secretory protein family protein [Gracilibacillus orientalis]|uniref:Cysteine-rich secretory protein family protein n=1 Tax=Gracilibacillus orientalis TaxID=334253 RepID=A0A1I4L6J5_9BACI|nr:CAP-associated domain-containing protein [Gracilibacillus orientalis]SFL86600.1 Cysteine-rich secretory protein family protein [Gracilibacillus orientalis]